LLTTGNRLAPVRPGVHRPRPRTGEHSSSRSATVVVAAIWRSMSGGSASENNGHTRDASGLFTSPAGRVPVGICGKYAKGPRYLAGTAKASAIYAGPRGRLVTNIEAEVTVAGRPARAGSDLRKATSGNPGANPTLAQRTGPHPRTPAGAHITRPTAPRVAGIDERRPRGADRHLGAPPGMRKAARPHGRANGNSSTDG
jgi:hypothetical protein